MGRYALKDSRFSSEILKYMALLRGAGKEPHAGAGAGGAGARAKAASTAWNPYFGNPGSKRAKHIDIRYHWVREQVLKHKTVVFIYCPTQDNVADMLTKALGELQLRRFRALMCGSGGEQPSM